MSVDDLNLTLASGAADAAAANGAGLTIDGASATLLYASSGDKFVFNKTVDATIGTAAQPNITSLGTLTGLTTTGNINFGDNDKAIFGTGNDLQLYHSSGNSYIDNNKGALFIRNNVDDDDNNNIILQAKSGEYSIICDDDGAVTLYHDNLPKLATTSTGIDVTGTATMDALTIGGVTSVPFEAADHSKLDGIEANATADQTNAEIRTAVEAATDSNVFTDADHSKLNGIAANANNYVLPTNLAGDDINIDTGALTGATVISDLDFNITTNTSGLVTDANASVATRNLTLANLGYTGATDATNNTGDITAVTVSGNVTGGGTSGSVGIGFSSTPSFDSLTTTGNIGIGTTPTFGAGGGLEIERSGTCTIRLEDTSNKAAEIRMAEDFEIRSMNSGSDIVLDATGNIILDADGGGVAFKDGGVEFGLIEKSSSNIQIYNTISNGDIVFKGYDGGSGISALTLDISDAGSAIFNNNLYIPNAILHSGDTDTYIQFDAANSFKQVTGGVESYNVTASSFTINDGSADMDFRVESNNHSHAIFMNGYNGTVGFGGSTPQTSYNFIGAGGIYIGNGNQPSGDFMSIDAEGSAGGTSMTFYRYDSSASQYQNRLSIAGETAETVFNNSGLDVDFRVESNNNANMLFVDAGNDRITIGGNDGTGSLTVKNKDSSGADVHVVVQNTTANRIAGYKVQDESGNTGINLLYDNGGNTATLESPTGNLTLDVAGNIILDADGSAIKFKDGGASFGEIFKSSSNMIMYSTISNGDMKFMGVDGGNNITALTLDMSEAGAATFNGRVNIPGFIRHVGDDNSFFGFPSGDEYRLELAGVERMSMNGAESVFNEDGVDRDFRVESNNYTHALFVNGGNSRVGINDSAPDRELEVRGHDASTSHTVGIKVKNTNITTNSIAGIVFENYDNNGAYIRSLRSGSTAGILTFGINDGGGVAESNISEKLRISGFLVKPEAGVNIGSIRNNGVTISTSAVNVLNLGSVNSSGSKGRGRYLVTVCATGGTVGTAGSAIFGLSTSGAVYLYQTLNANSVSFGSNGAYVTASVSGGSYAVHVNAIPLSVDN
tara:strand:+ start:20 stop:3223 length:3204 start_codon:yes stop_codon:yes gene_type:complete